MTPAAYILELRELGVALTLQDDNLVCKAPKGVLTAAMQAELLSRKSELMAFLHAAETTAANEAHPFEIAERNGSPPLSFAQERLWYLDQLEPGSATYNLPTAIRLRGALELERLQQSLQAVVDRHEILRTRFTLENGAPVQAIEAAAAVELPLVDLSHLATAEQELAQRLQSQAMQPFDLSQAPLVRSVCFRLADVHHVLLFVAHHSVFDGPSLGILMQELAALYDAFATGEPPVLADAPVQYADYALWQRKVLDERERQRLLTYWRVQLHGELPTLQMPTDRPRPPRQAFDGASEKVMLPAEVAERLRETARSEGATFFMVLLAAFNVLLHRYTGQDDFVIGSPVTGRNRVELEAAIGFFVNTLALRADVSGEPTFRELLVRVREACLGAYCHQDLPFEELVREFETRRDLSRTPLFQALFAFQDISARTLESADLQWSTLRVDAKVAKTDLSLWLSESAAGVEMVLEYRTDLFDQETMKRLLAHYRCLLEALPEQCDVAVARLPLLSEPEREELLVGWNATQRVYPEASRVHELFEAQVKRTPHTVAALFEEDSQTYAQLNRRANQLAYRLRAAGVGPQSLVGICLDRSIDLLVGLLGILKAGGAYVPLDPYFPKDRLEYMLADAQVAVLLTSAAHVPELPAHEATVLLIDTEDPLHGKGEGKERSSDAAFSVGELSSVSAFSLDDNLAIDGDPEDLAYVIYTSGSTGRPKGVRVPHRAVVNFLCSMGETPGLSAGDRLLAVTTLSFDIAVLELFLPLMTGASVVIAASDAVTDGDALLELVSTQKVTVMQATPATWQLLIGAGWDEGTPLKVLCGGEPMPAGLAAQLVARSPSVWNLYGPTETTVWSTCQQVQDGPVLIGQPIANTSVYVLNAQGQPVPVGVAGELVIGGHGVTHGYHNLPELTAERFVPDTFANDGGRLYRTGDLARWRPDGVLEHLGRIDSQVKVRGFRIELGEIESVLQACPGIERVAASIWLAAPGDQRLVAYLVLLPGERLDTAALRKQLSTMLPNYMLPQHYVALEDLPLTPNGKLDRKRLPPPTTTPADKPRREPQTEMEKLLAGIWSRLIGIEEIGRHDNFFEIGGHSLLAVKAIIELEKATGERIGLRNILLEDLCQIARLVSESPPAAASGRSGARGGILRRLLFARRPKPGHTSVSL